jgi:hypothetical protein
MCGATPEQAEHGGGVQQIEDQHRPPCRRGPQRYELLQQALNSRGVTMLKPLACAERAIKLPCIPQPTRVNP